LRSAWEKSKTLFLENKMDVVAHAFDPSKLGGGGRRSEVRSGGPRQKQRSYVKNKPKQKRTGGMAQVVKCSQKALSSRLRQTKKKKK
jgi:hypothetical protein